MEVLGVIALQLLRVVAVGMFEAVIESRVLAGIAGVRRRFFPRKPARKKRKARRAT